MRLAVSWASPSTLYGLWALVPLGYLLWRAHRKRLAAARTLLGDRMTRRLAPPMGGPRSYLRSGLILAGLASLVFAAARPRWGKSVETVTRRGADLMVLLDVSRSMLSRDVAPDRLDRAKSDLADLVHDLKGERVGLVAFAGRAVLLCPLTTDRAFFLQRLRSAGPDSAPRGGTAIGDAIRKGLSDMERRGDRDQAFLLVTDGGDHDSHPEQAAAVAAQRGIKIFTIGMGDPSKGARIPVTGEGGASVYLKYKGQEVWSKMDESLLKDIALKTHAAYVPARTSAYDLGKVYRDHLAKLAGGEGTTERRERLHERYQVFLAAGLLFLLAPFLVLPWARGALVLLLFCFAARPAAADGASSEVAAGVARFKQGKLEEARRHFERAGKLAPDDPRVAFDEAAVLQAKGKLDEAASLYEKATSDSALGPRAQYNLGTLAVAKARAALGEKPEDVFGKARDEGLNQVHEAIRRFRAALDSDPGYEDARSNLESLRLWLERMTAVWKKKDRERERKSMNALQFLEMLLQKEQELRDGLDAIQPMPESPLKREALREAREGQKDLLDDIDPLKAKIDGAAKKSGAPKKAMKRALDALHKLAEDARKAMSGAAADLDGASVDAAKASEERATDALERIWEALAPFERVLKRAVAEQTGLGGATAALEKKKDADCTRAARLQSRVAEEASILAPKAQAELARAKAQAKMAKPAPKNPKTKGKVAPAGSRPPDLNQAYEKALALGPKAFAAAEKAAKKLAASNAKKAQPDQKEALRLLKEIEDALPKPPPQKKKKDEKNQKKKGAGKKKQQQGKSGRNRQERQKPGTLSREQVAAILRKALERERKHEKEKRKEKRAVAVGTGTGKVDRDW